MVGCYATVGRDTMVGRDAISPDVRRGGWMLCIHVLLLILFHLPFLAKIYPKATPSSHWISLSRALQL